MNIKRHAVLIRSILYNRFHMGRFNQAIDVFQEAENLSPRPDHEIYHFMGEIFLRSAATSKQSEFAFQEIAKAKQYFQKSMQCGKNLQSFRCLAEIYRKERDYVKAIETLENCLQ